MEYFSPQISRIASKYDTDEIFIVGKGPSVDQIDPEIFSRGIVINLNDSGRIVPGNFCVFHAPWVVESLSEFGFGTAFYIASQDLPPGVSGVKVDYVPMDEESSDLMVQRFNEDGFSIEGVLLVSALKVAKLIADQRMKRQKIYMIGFDFNIGKGYSKKIETDYSGDEKNYQSNIISSQEHYYLMFAHLLRNSNLHVQHFGTKSYSDLDLDDFNRRFTGRSSRVGETESPKNASQPAKAKPNPHRADDRVLITAEITTNHFGDLNRLEKMVRRASDCGADLVKLQKRDVESFYSKAQLDSAYQSPFGETFRDYRNALELDEAAFASLDELCREVGIQWFVSLLDLPSFHFMQKFSPPLLKLPSTISQHEEFIKAVSEDFTGPVVVSTGFTEQSYEDFIIETFVRNEKLFILQCTLAYPTPPEDCNVAVVRHYHKLSKRYPNVLAGYSSHDFGATGCMLAVAAGAKMIEKHVKFGDTDWAHFDSVALDLKTDEFAKFVSDIRLAERMVGDEVKKPTDNEHHKYWVRP